MNRLYGQPLRVYLLLGALAALGIVCGLKLPVSLFPNSSKPEIYVSVPYANFTASEFLDTFGKRLEERLRAITSDGLKVEKIDGDYRNRSVNYKVHFKWGSKPAEALRETRNVVNAFSARLPEEARDGIWVELDNENSGFFALSFFSETRDLDSLYELLEPILGPRIGAVADAQDAVLWNPTSKEIRLELQPETLAALQLFPKDVEAAVNSALGARSGGSLTIGVNQFQVQLPRQIKEAEDLGQIIIPSPTGRSVHLSEVARVDMGPKSMDSHSFKTSGAPSLILYAAPRPGGNVKKMSEDMLEIVKNVMPTLPPDVRYRTLVDPSEFIRSAVDNVFREVFVAAAFAVAVLFLFIGSVRNVITAAIEIPLSMVLAFILMRLFGMNLNLISLGGLALSAGMNVDASVVVMENIFRHFEMTPGPHDAPARLRIVSNAVAEVRFAILASTIASLVVFLPLTFTSDLSYAILGDLALAVVFSHAFSAIVALILVPTVRLQLMSRGSEKSLHSHSPIEKPLKRLENFYGRALGKFIASPQIKRWTYGSLVASLVALTAFVLPSLPKEVLGIPDTDWMNIHLSTAGNTMLRQMELQQEEIERQLLTEFGSQIQYTFSRVHEPNEGGILARLKDKREMRSLWKKLEARFTNTPLIRFGVGPWNPSELPIPDPPQMRIVVRGTSPAERAEATRELGDLLHDKKVFPQLNTRPDPARTQGVFLSPHMAQWNSLRASGAGFTGADLIDLTRVATTGRKIGYFPVKNRSTEIVLHFPKDRIASFEDILSLPVGVGSKIIPLKALAAVEIKESEPSIYREDQRELYMINGRETRGEERKAKQSLARANEVLSDWKKRPHGGATAEIVDPAPDLNGAINQLSVAVGLSVALIFLVLILQFGSFAEALLVMVSVPLGFIGVLSSLFVFQSTLSLNSILGIILLNGIAVANSIILVDFIKRLVEQGRTPREAALEAARTRLRPILITSLTTVLGMLPIALGLGEGGHILQPLGIAVCGGLWVSMTLTLLLVPALQVSYLEMAARQKPAGPKPFRFQKLSLGKSFRLWVGAFALVFISTTVRATGTDEKKLTYEEAIEAIVARNTDVIGQKATAEATEAKNLSTQLTMLPSVSLSRGLLRSNTLGNDLNRRGVEGDLSLNLFKFGSDLSAMRAGSADVSAQNLLYQNSIIYTEAAAVRTLNTLIQREMEQDIWQRIVDLRKLSLSIARERFERGLLAQQEVMKVSVDYENDVARLRDAQAEVVRAQAATVQLLGHELVERNWPWKQRIDRDFAIVENFDSHQLRARPDWKAAEKTWEAAKHRASQNLGKIFPSLDLNLSYGYYNESQLGGDENRPQWSAGLQLTVPLFDKLSNFSNYQSQVKTAVSSEQDLEKIRRAARADLDGAKGSLKISLDSAKSRETTLSVSRQLYQDNLKRFQRGLIDANALSVDQERLYRSELLAVAGWSHVHSDFQKLCHSVGRRLKVCAAENRREE